MVWGHRAAQGRLWLYSVLPSPPHAQRQCQQEEWSYGPLQCLQKAQAWARRPRPHCQSRAYRERAARTPSPAQSARLACCTLPCALCVRRCSAAKGPLHKGGTAQLHPAAVVAEGRHTSPPLFLVVVWTLLVRVLPQPLLLLVQMCMQALLPLQEAARTSVETRA